MATSETLSQSLVFDIQFGAIRGDGQARRALEEMASAAFGAGTIKGIKGASKAMENDVMQIMANAFKVGMRREGKELYRQFESAGKALKSAREDIARIDQRMLQVTDQASRTRLARERAAHEQRIKNENTALAASIKELDGASQRFGEMIEEASRNASRNFSQSVKKAGEGFSKWVGKGLDLRSGMPDPQQMGSAFGSAVTGKMGPALGKFAAKQAGKGGMMGMMGSAAGAMAGAAAAIAGAAAAIGAVVAILAAAYGQAKELNKAILQGQAAADMFDVMASRGRGLGEQLETTRRAALQVAAQFRMTGEEVAGMMGEISGAGLLMRQWGDYTGEAVDRMKQLSMVTRQTITMQTAFGVSASEIAGFQSTMFQDMGRGLERVNDAFVSIFSSSQKSTMTTKGFFTAVAEASSGMALYNFRVEDTVALLTDMVSVLGEDLASSQITQGNEYKSMGMEDRMRTLMNAGGNASAIFGADFQRQAGAFATNFADELGRSDFAGGAMNSLFAADGINLDMDKLSTIGEESFGDMLHQLRESGGVRGEQAARRLESMRPLARGAAGGLAAQASGMGHLSQSGALGMKLMEASTLLGNRGVSSMEGLTRQSYESITGRSGEDFDILQVLDRKYRGEYRAGGGESELGAFEDWIVGAIGEGNDSDMQELQNLSQLPAMERLARDQFMETRSVVQTLKNTIAGWLETIWGGVNGIMRAFSWGSANEDAWNSNVDSALSGVERQSLEIEQLGDVRTGLMEQRNQARDAGEIAEIDSQLATLEGVQALAQEELDRQREYYAELVRYGPAASVEEMAQAPAQYDGITGLGIDTDADFMTRLAMYGGGADGLVQTFMSPIMAAVDPLHSEGFVNEGDDAQRAIAANRKLETTLARREHLEGLGRQAVTWNEGGQGSWESQPLTGENLVHFLQTQGLRAGDRMGGGERMFGIPFQSYGNAWNNEDGQQGALDEIRTVAAMQAGQINPSSITHRPDYDDYMYSSDMLGDLTETQWNALVTSYLANTLPSGPLNPTDFGSSVGTATSPNWYPNSTHAGPSSQFPGRWGEEQARESAAIQGLAMAIIMSDRRNGGTGAVEHSSLLQSDGTYRDPVIGLGPNADLTEENIVQAGIWMNSSESDDQLLGGLFDYAALMNTGDPEDARDAAAMLTETKDTAEHSGDAVEELATVVTRLTAIERELSRDPLSTIAGGLGSSQLVAATALTTGEGYDEAERRLRTRMRSADPQVKETAGEALAELLRFGRPEEDFLMRPGSPPVRFSPNDTIIGAKGAGLRGLGGGTTININGGDQAVVYRTVMRAMKAAGGG